MTPDLSYPLGRFDPASPVTPAMRGPAIEEIARLPVHVRAAIHGLSGAQLDTAYRRGGWTARQVVHHVADSHANGYIRMKLALTEDTPAIKPYGRTSGRHCPTWVFRSTPRCRSWTVFTPGGRRSGWHLVR